MIDQGVGSLLVGVAFLVLHFILISGAYLFPIRRLRITVLWIFLCAFVAFVTLLSRNVEENSNFAGASAGFLTAFLFSGSEYVVMGAKDLKRGKFSKTSSVLFADQKRLITNVDDLTTTLFRPLFLLSVSLMFFIYKVVDSQASMVLNLYAQVQPRYRFEPAQLAATPVLHTVISWVQFAFCASIVLSFIMPIKGQNKDLAFVMALVFLAMLGGCLILVTCVLYSDLGINFQVGMIPSLVGWGFLASVAYTLGLMRVSWYAVSRNADVKPEFVLAIMPKTESHFTLARGLLVGKGK